MTKLTTATDVGLARNKHNELVDHAVNMKKSWIEFFTRLAEFQDTVVHGKRLYELLGYNTFTDYLDWFCDRYGLGWRQTRRMLAVVKSVPLPTATLRQLGKERAIAAARLVYHNKFNESWTKRLLSMKVEKAQAAVAKAVGTTGEGKRRLQVYIKESQFELYEEQRQRFIHATGDETQEGFFDFLLGLVSGLSDDQFALGVAGEGG